MCSLRSRRRRRRPRRRRPPRRRLPRPRSRPRSRRPSVRVYFASWPRIAPPGNSALWTLT
ncbi:MAG: hypothetical protein EPO51_00110 [Phenylobacterium sp.]|nr:MAG: hypothetical protein EPO51_00110 [Phenylobacterium sp.]